MKGMSLQDLVAGHSATHEPVGSGLQSLVRPAVATEPTLERPNLPRMLNALKRGELVEPPTGIQVTFVHATKWGNPDAERINGKPVGPVLDLPVNGNGGKR
jgi:hypothetical protein